MEIFPGGSGLSPSKEVNKGEIIIIIIITGENLILGYTYPLTLKGKLRQKLKFHQL